MRPPATAEKGGTARDKGCVINRQGQLDPVAVASVIKYFLLMKLLLMMFRLLLLLVPLASVINPFM